MLADQQEVDLKLETKIAVTKIEPESIWKKRGYTPSHVSFFFQFFIFIFFRVAAHRACKTNPF